MTSMNSISDSNGSTASMADQLKGSQLSQEGFMKLLLAQLRLQSPTSPFDSSTMMQQISQLTSLSSTQELEKTVKSLNANMGTTHVLEAAHLVGKHVQIPSEQCALTGGAGLSGAAIVPPGVDTVRISIRDSSDKVIKTLTLNAGTPGALNFSWDGMDQNQHPMTPGLYKVTASAEVNGDTTAIPIAGTFKVDSVALDKNGKGVILNVDGLGGVAMNDIIKIM